MNITSYKKILGITPQSNSKKLILENIKKYLDLPNGFFHVVSLNPENIVVSLKDDKFKQIVETAQIKIVDGVGVAIAGKVLGVAVGERLAGVDLMQELIREADKRSSTVMLIGAKDNLAEKLSKCYSQIYTEAKFIGVKGINDIEKSTDNEEKEIFSIVARTKPRFLFVAFGSPMQEKWIWEHRDKFEGIVCMGVGGAFDYVSGNINRPSNIIRSIGLEWLYRLVIQPWRWKRQLRLVEFTIDVLKQRCGLLQ